MLSVGASTFINKRPHREQESNIDTNETKSGVCLVQPIYSSAAEDETITGQEAEEDRIDDGHVQRKQLNDRLREQELQGQLDAALKS